MSNDDFKTIFHYSFMPHNVRNIEKAIVPQCIEQNSSKILWQPQTSQSREDWPLTLRPWSHYKGHLLDKGQISVTSLTLLKWQSVLKILQESKSVDPDRNLQPYDLHVAHKLLWFWGLCMIKMLLTATMYHCTQTVYHSDCL